MLLQSILVFHICAGFIGLVAGGVAIILAQGLSSTRSNRRRLRRIDALYVRERRLCRLHADATSERSSRSLYVLHGGDRLEDS